MYVHKKRTKKKQNKIKTITTNIHMYVHEHCTDECPVHSLWTRYLRLPATVLTTTSTITIIIIITIITIITTLIIIIIITLIIIIIIITITIIITIIIITFAWPRTGPINSKEGGLYRVPSDHIRRTGANAT